MQNIINSFQEAGREHGLEIPYDLTPGKIKRFNDGARGNKNAWAVLYPNDDGSAGGAFGNWKDVNEKFFYSPEGKSFSEEDKKRFAQQIEESRVAERDKRLKDQEAAAKVAQNKWNDAGPADVEHPYLKTKKIHPYGLKQSDDNLIIQLKDEFGEIRSIQTIDPDGVKRFLPGGQTKECFYILGNLEPSESLYICEGYATGSTIHAITQTPVVVAFNSGNLDAVSRIIRKKYPKKNIIIAADNDLNTEKKTGNNPGKDAAIKAANAINAKIVLSPVNSDFNDCYCQLEDKFKAIESVKKALSTEFKIEKENSSNWEAPVPFDVIVLPTMNLDIFPGPIGAMIKAVSDSIEAPVELAVCIALAVLATACHGNFFLQVKPGYTEPLNFWILVVLESANRKSSVMSIMIKPLVEWEARKAVDLKDEIKIAKSKRKLQEALLKNLRTYYGKAEQDKRDSYESQIIDIENNLVQIPVIPRLWVQDVTPEKMGMLLHENKGRLSNFSAEGGIFDTISGRYSNNIPNLDIFLQAHAGDSVRVDRAGREPILLDNPALTFGLSPQPSVLWKIIGNEILRRTGFLARFSYLIPESTVGYRTFETSPVPLKIENDYHSLIDALLNIEAQKDVDGNEIPYKIELSKEAFESHLVFSKFVETQLRPDGRFANMTDWAGKLPGAAARIAGLFHCAKNPKQPWATEVSLKTMEEALELAAVFSGHAQKVFHSSDSDPKIKQATNILKWIEDGNLSTFKRRDCFEKFKGLLKKIDDLDPILKILVEHNYLRECVHAEKKAGRPSKMFDVNPEFTRGQN